MDCLFCKIIKGDVPSKKVYENEYVYAFHDISPMAPVHVLIVPKTHVESAAKLSGDNLIIMQHLTEAAIEIAKQLGIYESGFRTVLNSGKDAGQTVFHLHMHLLGGAALSDFGV
ncbi:MAG: histidine triad nucleotide-binding protein [Clostridia bacterium]|nr:histidine triad nucleotide-binding protein [Clostridia bacterium]